MFQDEFAVRLELLSVQTVLPRVTGLTTDILTIPGLCLETNFSHLR